MTAALLLLRAHWGKMLAVLLVAGAYGAGRVHQSWKEDSRSLDRVIAQLEADRKAFRQDMAAQKAAADRAANRSGAVHTAVQQWIKEARNDPARKPCPVTPARRERLRDAFERIDRAAAEAGPGGPE